MFYLINVSEFLTVVSTARFGEPVHKARLLIIIYFFFFNFFSLSLAFHPVFSKEGEQGYSSGV